MTNQKKEELKKDFWEYYKSLVLNNADKSKMLEMYADWFLSQFDNIINEKIEKIVNEKKKWELYKSNIPNDLYAGVKIDTLNDVITILKE